MVNAGSGRASKHIPAGSGSARMKRVFAKSARGVTLRMGAPGNVPSATRGAQRKLFRASRRQIEGAVILGYVQPVKCVRHVTAVERNCQNSTSQKWRRRCVTLTDVSAMRVARGHGRLGNV